MTRTRANAHTRTRRLLACTGLAAISLAGLNAQAAGAQEPADDQRPIVHDEGLDARPRTDSATNLAACYAGEKAWDAGTQDADGFSQYIPAWDDAPDSAVADTPVNLASSECEDVNLRITSELAEPLQARVCFYPTSTPDYCNQWTEIAVGDAGWNVIATGLVDGTRYVVEFANPGESVAGYIAD